MATVLDLPESVETAAGSQYLPKQIYEVIRKRDLVPQRREDAWLPDLTASNKNAITKLAAGAEEEYISVTTKLQSVIDAAIAATPEVESPVELNFPFIPTFNIGDKITMRGRNVGVTGDEVVTEIKYRFEEGTADEILVKASSVTAGVDPGQFVEAE